MNKQKELIKEIEEYQLIIDEAHKVIELYEQKIKNRINELLVKES